MSTTLPLHSNTTTPITTPIELNPDHLSTDQITSLKAEADIYGYNNGLLMFDQTTKLPFLCPFTLLPRQTPVVVYNRMWDIHQLMQELYAKVANSHDFLLAALKPMTTADPFLQMLVSTLEANKGRTSDPICLVSRSDYMIHENDYEKNPSHQEGDNNINNKDEMVIGKIGYTPLQVEFNSMSTGFASLSHRVNELHRYLLTSYQAPQNQEGQLFGQSLNKKEEEEEKKKEYQFVPHQGSSGVAQTLAQATTLMSQRFQSQYPKITQWVVVMVVQPGESNVADQRLIEYSLLKEHGIRMIRATLLDIEAHVEYNHKEGDGGNNNNNNNHNNNTNNTGTNNPPMWKLTPTQQLPIALFYFRSCYTPRDFNITGNEINPESQRLINVYQNIEKTDAIKCPNIGLHLAGTKKIQQLLTQPQILKQFIPDESQCAALLATFTSIYSLQGQDYENNHDIITYTKANPHEFVLKPMREGGGNNYYDTELTQFFNERSIDEINAMILMQRINPNINIKSILLSKAGGINIVNSISEYGIFGGFVGYIPQPSTTNNHLITLHNQPFGSLIRIKAVGVNEGGVAAGYSCLSSPLLE